MDLKIETQIMIFDLSQMNSRIHPLTCRGEGGSCVGESLLKARNVKGTDIIEAYCPNCGYKRDIYTGQFIKDYIYETEEFKYIYDKLLKIHRDGNAEKILNND